MVPNTSSITLQEAASTAKDTSLVETDGTQTQHRAHTARLYPSLAQLQKLDRQGHTARALWNLLHEWHGWGGRGGSIARRPSPREMDRQLRDARSHPLPGWEWLAQLSAQATQQVLWQYLRSWDRHYKRLSGPPRFKHRTTRMTIDLPQAADLRAVRVNRRWGEVTVLLVGRVRFRWTRPLPVTAEASRGRITGGRLVKDPLGWHICFRIQEPAVAVARRDTPAVGIDLGVAHTMALSDGQNLDMPNLLSYGDERRLRALQRKAARRRRAQRPGTLPSQRERDAYRRAVALRARQARRRTDWIHKATTPDRQELRHDRGRGPEHRRDDPLGSWHCRLSGQEC